MKTIDVTTADVVASPTAAALRPLCIPAQTAGQGDDDSVDRALDEPRGKIRDAQGEASFFQVFRQVQVEDRDSYGDAPEDAHEVGVEDEERHHQDQREHSRDHQKIDGGNSEGGESVDLFVHRHGSELGGEGRARAARHDDAGHHGPHFPGHSEADQVRDVDLGTELAELDGGDEGENQSDQKADQGHDGQGLGAALLDREGQVRGPEARLSPAETPHGEGDFTDERRHTPRFLEAGHDLLSNAFDPTRRGRLRRASATFGNRRRQGEQAACPRRKPGVLRSRNPGARPVGRGSAEM